MRKLIAKLDFLISHYFRTDASYLLSGVAWLATGQGVSLVFSFISALAFANLIPKETYGTYKYIFSIMAILSIPTLQGMTTAVSQAVARGNVGTYLPGVRAKLKWGMLTSLLSLLVSMYYYVNGDTLLATAFLMVSLFAPIIEGFSLWPSVLSGKKLFKESSQLNVVTQACILITTTTTLLLSLNILFILTSYLVSSAIMMYWAHRRVLSKFPELTDQTDNEGAVKFGTNLSFTSIVGMIVAQLDIILLWHFGGTAQVAIYAFALATTGPAKTFMKSIVFLANPKFAAQESVILRATLGEKIRKSFVIIVPVTVIYIGLLPYVYHLFFPAYVDSLPYAQAIGLIFLFFPGKLHSVAVSTRIDRRPIYIQNLTNPIVYGIFLITLIPLFGAWGAIAANIASYVFSWGFSYYYFRKMQ